MKVIVFVKATASSEAGVMPTEELMTAMGRYNAELVHAGIMRDGAGLHPSVKGVRVRFSGTERTVLNGPFAETKELVAGYWLWEVPSMEVAIEWVKKCPNPMPEPSEIEIRPYFTAEDFGEAMTPELREQEAQLEAALKQTQAASPVIPPATTTLRPYLFFSGRCEEALEFYKTALNAQVGMVLRFDESPDPTPPGMLQAGFERKIMHCDFRVGDLMVMASDGCDDTSRFEGFRLALSVSTEADTDRYFAALADGGRVDMPLMKTFWSPRYGQVTDKFGVGWMVMVAAHAPSSATNAPAPTAAEAAWQLPEPTPQHEWLLRLVGEWTFESECTMGPDQPPMKSTGSQTTRALGKLWTVGEMRNEGPDGQPAVSQFTLGYDPAKGRFVGTFVSSCMTHQWPYDGQLDTTGRVLTLDSEGPSFAGDGTLAKYQDLIEYVDTDHYRLSSRYQNADGSWFPFMHGTYTRVAAGR